jgi:phosphate transport system substrate-binding protein
MLSQDFNHAQSAVRVEVQGGGSTVGLRAVADRIAQIGMCSRDLKPDETFHTIEIARDGIAVVVHPSNPVDNLTVENIRRIFCGDIRNWKEVDGGDDREIRLITREEGSGTREAFSALVMAKERIAKRALTQESNGAVRELLRGDRCAIAYMSLGLVGPDLKKLKVEGAEPTREAMEAGAYRLSRSFLFVYSGDKPTPQARKFITYVLSDPAQAILRKRGLLPPRKKPAAATAPATPPAENRETVNNP